MTAVASPCEKICTVHPATGLCLGCGRSLSEIERWLSFTDAERSRVINELPQRLATMRATRA
jgi:uncharacterized protein